MFPEKQTRYYILWNGTGESRYVVMMFRLPGHALPELSIEHVNHKVHVQVGLLVRRSSFVHDHGDKPGTCLLSITR